MSKGDHLGDLEELMLLALLRLGAGSDGAAVRSLLAEEAARKVSVSTVYVTLTRLEQKGYVASWKGDPTAERGGKSRRLYEVRPEGVAALEKVRAVRDRLWAPIDAEAANG